jgi:hypothetical protein
MKKLILFSAAMLFAAVTFAQTTNESATKAPEKVAINTSNIAQPNSAISADIAADKLEIAAKDNARKVADAKLNTDAAIVRMDIKEKNYTKLKTDVVALKAARNAFYIDKAELRKEIKSLKQDIAINKKQKHYKH